MDDLKTYVKNDQERTGLLTIEKGFSDDIKMVFGLDKCAKATFKKGKHFTTENIQIDQDTTIQDIKQEGTYKYTVPWSEHRTWDPTYQNERKDQTRVLPKNKNSNKI